MKHFKLLLILILLPFIFFSCEDEEDPTPQLTIEGKWSMSDVEWRNANSFNGFYNPAWFGLLSFEYIFDDVGELVEISNAFNGGSFRRGGNYTINDDNTELTLEFDSGNDEVYEMTLEFNTMILEREETYNLPDPNSADPDNPDMIPVTLTSIYTYDRVF